MMMMMTMMKKAGLTSSLLGVVAALLLIAHSAHQVDAQKTLVLVDSASTKDTHSRFFAQLEAAGLKLKFAMADSTSLALEKYGERLFDNLIVFAPAAAQFGGSVTSDSIAEFVDHGGNVLVASSSVVAEAVANVGVAFGYEFGESGSSVLDHFSHAHDDPSLVQADDVAAIDVITDSPTKPILYRGNALAADASNTLIIPLLRAPSTALTAVGGVEGKPSSRVAQGHNIVLVGAMQARNNGRAVISGSLDLFSNELFVDSAADNAKFASAIALWCFGERGLLRKGDAVFTHKGQSDNAREFTIKDEVYYALPVEEKVGGEWVPFAGKDVQLVFHRMDPFVRRTLTNNNGVMETEFTLPDVYGVFQFRVDYERRGYTFLHDSQQVSVRPLRHTQYERFIVSAYPYYTGAFSMMIGFVVFTLVYLHHKKPQGESTKSQ